MQLSRSGLLALAIVGTTLATASNGAGGIVITVDNATTFEGAFTAENVETVLFKPVIFSSFPSAPGFPPLFFNASRDGMLFFQNFIFPDGLAEPFTENFNGLISDQPGQVTTFPDWSGQFTNGGPDNNQVVNWNFTNLRDTGGLEGLFMGNFQFKVVPEPSVSALLGMSFLGWAVWRQHRSRA